MTRRVSTILAAAALLAAAGSAHAQDAAAQAAATKDVFSKGFGIPALLPPDNLAASSLGIGPDAVTQIRNLSGLQVGLLGGLGRDGKFKGSFGLAFTPFTLGARIDVTNYRASALSAAIARSRLSLAISEAEAEGSDGSIAAGLQTVLFDRGDLYLRGADALPAGATGEYSSAVGACLLGLVQAQDGGFPTEPDEDQVAERSPYAPLFANCVRAQKKAAWNDASLGVGIVGVFRARDNRLSDVASANTVLYATAAYGFEGFDRADRLRVTKSGLASGCDKGFHLTCNAQLVLAAKYQSDALFDVQGRGPQTGKSFSYGARLVAGSPRSTVYGFYRQEEVDFDFGDRDLHEYGVGFETKLFGKTWFNVVVARKDDDILSDETSAKATVSWDLTGGPAFVNPLR